MHVNLSDSSQNFTSSRGFSNYFPQPTYQKSAIERYLDIADIDYPYYSEFSVDFSTMKREMR